MSPERLLHCRQCREWYGEDFFELQRSIGKSTYLRKLRCIGCRLTARTQEKQDGQRLIVKARSAIMTHGHRLGRKGIVRSAADLTGRFGWELHAMAHDIEHAFKNGCPYCRRPFHEMANGLSDLQLDIVDPAKPPYYSTNTKWCCGTCNRSKAKTDPTRWAKKLLWWEKWRQRQSQLQDNPYIDTLFDRGRAGRNERAVTIDRR